MSVEARASTQRHAVECPYRSLFREHPHGVFALDPRGAVLEANAAAVRISGYDVSQLLRMTLADFIIEDDAPRVAEAFGRVLAGESQQLDLTIRHVRGHTVDVAVTAIPWIEGEVARGVYGICEDVTERNRLNRELETVRRVATAASEAKSDFVARMSHEIRTPLTSIHAAVELLSLHDLHAEARHLVESVHRSGRRLLTLVESVLDFGAAGASDAGFEEEFDLHDLVGDVTAMTEGPARMKGLQVHLWLAPDVPRQVRGHPMWTTQILTNLLTNAVQHTETGRIELTVETMRVLTGGERVVYRVRDTGAGIPPGRQAEIFEPFVSGAQPGSAGGRGGTGLGLSIVRELVAVSGGTIAVDSEVGRGSTFTVALPVRPVAD